MCPVLRSSDRDALGDVQTWCFLYVSFLADQNTWVY